MNKIIKIEIAVGIILIIVVIIGALLLLNNKSISKNSKSNVNEKQVEKVIPDNNLTEVNQKAPEKIQMNNCENTTENKKELDMENRRSLKNKDWNTFVNWRDHYQFDYPVDKLSVEITQFTDSGDGQYWSAQIGYPDRLGTFADILVYYGNIEEVINSDYDRGTIQIVNKQDTLINGKKAVVVFWKDVDYSDEPVGKEIIIQYKEDRVLTINGPYENKDELQLFDKILESLVFIPELGENL